MKDFLLELFNTQDLELAVGALSLRIVFAASILLVLLTILSILLRDKAPYLKKPLFISIALVAGLSSFALIGSTVYVNSISESGGPVHWHADFEYWACGNELELRDPQGLLSNKIGTAVLHEHDDRRVHLEGVVVENRDASLGKFQKVIGGQLTNNSLVIPLNETESSSTYSGGIGNTFENDNTNDEGMPIDGDGVSDAHPGLVTPFIENTEEGRVARLINGQNCGDEEAEVQVFAYQYDEETKTYWQQKLENPADYVITDDSVVPPGDCIIFEFASPKDRTDKLCQQYGVRDIDRCTEFGVEPDETDICEIHEVDNPHQATDEDPENVSGQDSEEIKENETDNPSDNPPGNEGTE